MKAVFIIFFVVSYLTSFELKAQETDSTVTVEIKIAETTPEPEGGYPSIFKWFYDNIDVNRLTGLDTLDCQSSKNKVFVQFVIDETGQLIEPEIVKGIGSPYDEYCLELVSLMPIRWTPGTYGGRSVKIRSVLPFKFCQQEEQPESKKRKNRKRKRG
ncbi:MAG: energy transducer TonB [Marinoscillum sp.]